MTLTIDKTIIGGTKKIAAESGRSLSDLIENYLKRLIRQRSHANYVASENISFTVSEPMVTCHSNRLNNLRGIAKDNGRDYKQQLSELAKEKIPCMKLFIDSFQDALQYHYVTNNRSIHFIVTRNTKD